MKTILMIGMLLASFSVSHSAFADETEALQKIRTEIDEIKAELKQLAVAPRGGAWTCSARCGGYRDRDKVLHSASIMATADTLANAWTNLIETCLKYDEENLGFRLIEIKNINPPVNKQVNYTYATMKESCKLDPNATP